MAQNPPIDDAYINEIIKSNEPYNPALLTTQGVKFRELIKLLRDRMEQGDSDAVKVTGDQSISGTKTFTLVKADWISVNNLADSSLDTVISPVKGIETKLLNLNAGSFATQLSSQGLSAFRTQTLQDKSGVIALTSDIEDLTPYQLRSEKGQSNGYAGLDSGSKLLLANIPDSLLGQVAYIGTWDASTNTPTLVIPSDLSTKGHYYINTVVGTQFGIDFQVGDWIISNGTQWDKVGNTDAVITVFGRLGNILAVDTDYSAYYPLLSGSYVNPSWITSLPYSKITGTPDLSGCVPYNGATGDVDFNLIQLLNTGNIVSNGSITGFSITSIAGLTVGSRLNIGTAAASVQGSMGKSLSLGTVLRGSAGSISDLTFRNSSGVDIFSNPTETSDLVVVGSVTAPTFIGDLTGTASNNELLVNKATDFSTVNNTLYPTVQATKTYVDSKASPILLTGSTLHNATTIGVTATYANFFGYDAGYEAFNASYSTLIGFNTGKKSTFHNIGSNNIIIGTNISLPNATANAINIGGILYGTGAYATTTGNPSILPANGKIGVNIVNPAEALDVLGNVKVSGTVIAGGDTPPTIVLGPTANVGTGASITIEGNNIDGVITLTTGTGIGGNAGDLFTITMGGGFAYPTVCLPVSNNLFVVGTTTPARSLTVKNLTANAWTGNLGSPLTDSKVYKWTYHAGGY
jgi:hypothetical protein